MSVPDFMAAQRAGDVAASRAPVPKVLGQRPQDDGTVLVTFALPGLRRHTVRVPQSVWLQGDHLTIGANVHIALDALLPPLQPDDVEPPADSVDDAG